MHPAFAALYDIGEDDAFGIYLVFEFVDGPSLRERLANGALSPLEVAALARTLGMGLTHSHASGIVHGDIIPENVQLSPFGAKLTGLGFPSPSETTLPTRDIYADSLAYCAPEILTLRAFSARSDQFAFAAICYEALTSRRAFEGGDVSTLILAITDGKPPPVTRIAALRPFGALDAVFERAFSKSPNARFPSCEAFGRALANELERPVVLNIPSPPSSRSSIVPRATRRWQNAIVLAAITVILALAFAGRFAPSGSGEGVTLKGIADEFANLASTSRPSATLNSHRQTKPPAASATSANPSLTPDPSLPANKPVDAGADSSPVDPL
jgi:serine/threonine-protein kinase